MNHAISRLDDHSFSLPLSGRILCILHLCVAFTLLACYAGTPFMQEWHEIKSRMQVFESILGTDDPALADAFKNLPEQEKIHLRKAWDHLSDRTQLSFSKKFRLSGEVIWYQMHPYIKLWLVLSIIVPILILKRVEGSPLAGWICPLMIALYTWDAYLHPGSFDSLSSEDHLYPSESEIIAHFLEGPLNPGILAQREQLLAGWQKYLIVQWAQEAPSSDPQVFERQLKEGQFRFTLRRAAFLADHPFTTDLRVYPRVRSSFLLLAFFVWNFGFALYVTAQHSTLYFWSREGNRKIRLKKILNSPN